MIMIMIQNFSFVALDHGARFSETTAALRHSSHFRSQIERQLSTSSPARRQSLPDPLILLENPSIDT
jgi:hypothetical protein